MVCPANKHFSMMILGLHKNDYQIRELFLELLIPYSWTLPPQTTDGQLVMNLLVDFHWTFGMAPDWPGTESTCEKQCPGAGHDLLCIFLKAGVNHLSRLSRDQTSWVAIIMLASHPSPTYHKSIRITDWKPMIVVHSQNLQTWQNPIT